MNWPEAPLGSLFERITYGFTNPMETTESGPFMVTAKDIHDGQIDYETARRTSPESYNTRLTDKSRPRVGDLLLTKDGSIGRLAICDREPLCINQSVALLQPLPTTNVSFVKYLLETPHFQAKMAADSDGSTIKHIYITRVDKMLIPVPSLPEQQAIAEVLGALDDKIAANRALVATADELAEDIFVAATRALPERGLDDLVRPTSGGTPKRDIPEYWTGGTPWVSVRDIHRESAGAILTTEESISPAGAANSAAKQAPRGTVILTARGTVGEVGRLTTPGAFNQSCYGFIPGDVPPAVLFHLIRVAARSSRRVAHGSVFSTITTKTMSALTVPDITKLDCPELETQLAPLHEVIDGACREAASLASLRDTLLPALMDGTIRVKDAITKAEEVL